MDINTLDDSDLLEKVVNMTNVREHNDVTVSIKVQQLIQISLCKICIAILTVTSPIVINVPTRGLLAVETKDFFVLWLANLNIKRIVYKQ